MLQAYKDVLGELDIQVEPFAICTLEGTTILTIDQRREAVWHYVMEGEGELKIPSMKSIDLRAGRIILVPAGVRHNLISDGSANTDRTIDIPPELPLKRLCAKGEGQNRLTVLCGEVSLSLRHTNGLVDLLRAPLHMDVENSAVAERALSGIVHEISDPRTGCRAMVRLLLLQCVFEMLRERLEAEDPALMWLAGLADPRLWQALHVILDDPGAPHSLESLAEVSGMSRSSFAELFKRAYGLAPMSFLRELRMARAAQLLRDGNEPVKRIAERMGFQSRSAFTRSFTEFSGQSPREFRSTEH